MLDSNLTDAELDLLQRFVVRNRKAEDSTETGRWAARCRDLIAELERLQHRAAHLSEEAVEAGAADREFSDTAII